MKKLVMAAIVALPSIALAGPFYGVANLGAGFSEGKVTAALAEKKSITAIFAEVGLGKYVYCNNLRVDLTAIGMGANNDKARLKAVNGATVGTYKTRYNTAGGMLNFSYDFMPGEMFNPYVTAGIGVLRTELELKATGSAPAVATILKKNSKSKTSMAGRVGLGGAIKMTDGMHLVGGYSYIFKERDLGSVELLTTTSKVKFKADNIHAATLGFRFIF